MRIFGVILIVFGLLLTLSIIFWFIGVPLMFIGTLLVALGGKPSSVTTIVQVSGHPNVGNNVDSRDHAGSIPRVGAYDARPAIDVSANKD